MPDFDTSVPHIARVYDYWLGSKDNFAADRELGEQTLDAYPSLVFSGWRPDSDLEAARPTGLWGGVAPQAGRLEAPGQVTGISLVSRCHGIVVVSGSVVDCGYWGTRNPPPSPDQPRK
jgi:S-adenosyl methyltransferase